MLSYNSPVSAQPSTTNTIPNMPLGTNPKPIPVSAGPVTSNNTIAKAAGVPSPKYHHIWLVTGPAGCGKSTVANYIATALDFPYIEGDEVPRPSPPCSICMHVLTWSSSTLLRISSR